MDHRQSLTANPGLDHATGAREQVTIRDDETRQQAGSRSHPVDREHRTIRRALWSALAARPRAANPGDRLTHRGQERRRRWESWLVKASRTPACSNRAGFSGARSQCSRSSISAFNADSRRDVGWRWKRNGYDDRAVLVRDLTQSPIFATAATIDGSQSEFLRELLGAKQVLFGIGVEDHQGGGLAGRDALGQGRKALRTSSTSSVSDGRVARSRYQAASRNA